MQDAVRYTLPAGFSIESAPKGEAAKFQNLAAYSLTSIQANNTITLRRDFILADLYFPFKDYAELRTFYNEFERKDHGSVVLKRSTDSASVQPSRYLALP